MPEKKQPTPRPTAADTLKRKMERLAAEKLEAEIRKLEIEARQVQIEVEIDHYKQQIAMGGDFPNRIYRFTGEVREHSVSNCMQDLSVMHRMDPGCDIEVIFSSPGGSVVDGLALFDFLQVLRAEGHRVTTGALGMAASMAGILLQAGDHRWIGEQAWILVHEVSFGAHGKFAEIADEVEWVKKVQERVLGIFEARTHMTRRELQKQWNRRDWWLDAAEALKLGFVDEVRGHLL